MKEETEAIEIYHVFNKSIAGFKIFNNNAEFLRMKNLLRYYQIENMPIAFSRFVQTKRAEKYDFNGCFVSASKAKYKFVQIIAYCIMPTHLHLILKQLQERAISTFMSNVLNSYTRYFNTKINRKGPLWESRTKKVLVKTDEQLLHLTRYVHLNPVTARLVQKPEQWERSSYLEYLNKIEDEDKICEYSDILNCESNQYKQFVEDGISYQRDLAKIKSILFE